MSDIDKTLEPIAFPDPVRVAVPEAIAAPRVVAIGRRLEAGRLVAIAEALVAGGVHAFELTLDGTDALAGIRELTRRFAAAELLVGAGTVLTSFAAEGALDAGARFLVMPNLDVGIVRYGAERGVPTFPGVFTPTEAYAAWQAGASAVKLFPASAAGPSWVRELHGPFRDIPVVPTGGVTAENAPAFIEAGSIAVGLGSWLTGAGDPELTEERARTLTERLAGLGR